MSYAIELVSSTIESYEKFATLLQDENLQLQERNVDAVENNIKKKRHLAAKIEKLLATVKSSVSEIKEDPTALDRLPALQVSVDNYQLVARKNMILLQAAHTATNDFLGLVRRALDLKKPKTQTYGKTGAMNTHNSSTKLVNKDI